ncbi:MAG TPA: TonB-dependent receptor, partial [Bacteroidales bacterium]
MKKIFQIIIVFLLLSNSLLGQVQDIVINSEYKNLSWAEFVTKVENNYPVRFFYYETEIPDFKVTFTNETIFLGELLKKDLGKQNLYFDYDKAGNIFISKTKFEIRKLPEKFFDSIIYQKQGKKAEEVDKTTGSEYITTNKNLITRTVTIGNNKDGANSRYFTLSGYVKSATNKEAIVGGRLIIKETGAGTTTDENGFYTLRLKKGTYTLEVNSLESKEQKVRIIGLSDGTLDFSLEENQYMLDEVEINSAVDDNVRGIQMGYEKLTAKELKEVPTVLGERDIVKVALLLPGVQVVGEGAAGFNVRGSPADQNMFYVSKIAVYNTSHLFGFFSSFNPDLIEDFTLYKSNIPAKYGGRLSSIFDIKTKQGRQDHFSARGGISPVTARLMVEGPIVKNKLSYIAGIRTTYSNWIMRSLPDPIISHSTAYFGDGNLGLSYNPNNKNQIKLYSYYSNDNVNLYPSNQYDYANAGASAEWTHILRKRQILDLSMQYSYYQFNGENTEYAPAAYSQGYNLQQIEFDASYNFKLGEKHDINTGLTSIIYLIDNGDFLPLNDESDVKPVYLGNEKGSETGIYISDEWKPWPVLTI